MRYSFIPRRSWAQWANERAEYLREGRQFVPVPVSFHEYRAMPNGRIGIVFPEGDS